MRHAILLVNDTGEGKDLVVFLNKFLNKDEARLLTEIGAAAVKANPRRSSFRSMLKKLEALECW